LKRQQKYFDRGNANENSYTDVRVPSGTKIHRGKVAENFGGGEGAIQYHLQDRLPSDAYTNTRLLRGN
jgi:hypothetical protein